MAKKIYSNTQVLGSVAASSLEIIGEYTLPAVDGSANQVMLTNGAGTVSFAGVNSLITAENGLSWSGTSNLHLGGALTKNTVINATGSYTLSVSGSISTAKGYVFAVQNTSTGNGISSAVTSGTSVYGSATSGDAIRGDATTGRGGYFFSNSGTTALYAFSQNGQALQADGKNKPNIFAVNYPSGSIESILRLVNNGTLGALTVGTGASLDFQLYNSASVIWSKITSKVETVSPTEASIGFYNLTAGSLTRKLNIAHTGQLTADLYGTGTFTGTAARNLSVTSAGEIIEVAGATGTFTSQDGKTVTVTNGLITSITP